MKVKKIAKHKLEKCYSIAELNIDGQRNIAVAAEKTDDCLLFDMQGNLIETIWEGPSGTMSMVPIPCKENIFLATQKFYSPNDSKEAKIVVVKKDETGKWIVNTLLDLPHVHRFGIITRDGINYIIACTICSGRDFKDDWAHKGKLYASVLPDDLSQYNEQNQFEMSVIKDELLKNHGYYAGVENGYDYAVIGADDGVFKIIPPSKGETKFEIIELLNTPASDMTFCDYDNDGMLEMCVFSPFHGENLDVYKINNKYEKVYTYEKTFDFSHALWSGQINGENISILGSRQGERNLICLSYKDNAYQVQVLDNDVGPANVLAYKYNDKHFIVAANREIDEVSFYEVMGD